MVQLVMLLLLAASVFSWAIIIERVFVLRRAKILSNKFEEHFWSGESIDDLYNRFRERDQDPLSTVFCAGTMEWERASREISPDLLARIQQVMENTLNKEMGKLEAKISFLATVGSVAPFIGLFGTVWGIVNSFRSIGLEKSTSLAVVAPHMSEALFATALGLLAAIPAVMAYNRFSESINQIGRQTDIFINDFVVLLARKLDRKKKIA